MSKINQSPQNSLEKRTIKDPINFLYLIKKIYPIYFKAKPSYFIFNQTVGVAYGLSNGIELLAMQIFYDAVANTIIQRTSIKFAFLMLVFYTLVRISMNILNAVHIFAKTANNQIVSGAFGVMIADKSRRINPIEYENPSRLTDINKAQNGIEPANQFVTVTSTIITFYLPYFLFTAFYLFTVNPLLIFIILLIFIPSIISQLLYTGIFSKLEDEVAPIRRERDAYSGSAVMPETRILGAFNFFNKLYESSILRFNKANWKATLRSQIIDLCLGLLSLVGYGGILFLLCYLLLNGQISPGQFAAIFYSVGKIYRIVHEIVNQNIGNITQNFGIIRNLIRFLDIPQEDRNQEKLNKQCDINIKNVTFRYPNSNRDSLNNINLIIKKGETIAIVGENGAGKTTLVKVITGMYTPTEGKVLYDNSSIHDINYGIMFESISGVYQKYQQYKLTLEENIKISDFNSDKSIDDILKQNNIEQDNMETFPQGKNTVLSREFDGTDISGGQWQRVSIARGFYRDSDIIILDEPTAAIDPIEESKIYKRFMDIARGKTSIIITHRLGSVKNADRIVVMQESKIEEIGTHEELLSLTGVYYKMFTAQSQWYDNNSLITSSDE